MEMAITDHITYQDPPLISVITAVYNGERYLEQTIKSVINQTYPNLEYIIIDGGSTDGTNNIIQRYKDKIAYSISEKDNGVYDAWNKGVKAARGTWIVFLGADDYFLNLEVCNDMIPYFGQAAKNNIRYIYGKISLRSASNKQIAMLGKPWDESRKDLFQYMSLPHCASFHSYLLFKENGLFNTQFKIAGDYEFLLREFTQNNRNALFCDKELAGMRIGGLSANIKLKLRLARENILARKLNNLPPTISHRWLVIKAKIAMLLVSLTGEKTVNNISDFLRTAKGKEKMWTTTEEVHE